MDEADAELIEQLYSDLRAFAAVVADPDVDPDDLVHDALLGLLRRGSLLGLEHPLAYARRSILNLVSNRRRGSARRRSALRRFAAGRAELVDHYPSDLDDLFRLAPKLRAVVWLVDVERRTFVEVADVLGCSEPAARARASRGRRELRRVLSTEGDQLDAKGTVT